MNNNTNPLKHVSIKILEDWAMMMVEEAEHSLEIFDQSTPCYISSVNMHGDFKGTLYIVAQSDFMKTLAANLLGQSEEQPPSEEESRDAFREMGNVLAGNFFTETYGANVAYDLIYPNVSEATPIEISKLRDQSTALYFLADNFPIMITFTFGV